MTGEASTDWRVRALSATRETLTGAIIHAALRATNQWPLSVPLALTPPYFQGRATITSDEFVLCHYIRRDGNYEPGALVGSLEEVVINVAGLCKHLSLNTTEQEALWMCVNSWLRR